MGSLTLPKRKAVVLHIEDQELPGHVKKVALGDFATLAVMIEGLVSDGAQLDKLMESPDLKTLLEVVKTAPDKIADMVALISTFSREDILRADIESVLDIVVEGWALNNVVKMFRGALKKVMGAPQDAPVEKDSGSTGSSPA